jgi:hypothetical protein
MNTTRTFIRDLAAGDIFHFDGQSHNTNVVESVRTEANLTSLIYMGVLGREILTRVSLTTVMKVA